MRALLPTLALLAVAAPAADAATADEPRKRRPLTQSKLLWATVNICDTPGHPDAIGIRGSMPGSGFRDEVMWMRFQVQYYNRAERMWHNTGEAGDSGWVRVGSALRRRREAGRTFTIEPPASGSYVLRGAVTFEWRLRKGGDVVRRARERTTSGHKQARGGDPAGWSAADCVVS